MSSKHNHINTGNYEAFFLLYVDGELAAGEQKMVEDFLLEHPELQPELDLLLGTRLTAEPLLLDKTSLFSGSMKADAMDESLLLYLDNELSAEGKQAVELELAANADYRKQYEVLDLTRLDASETVAYPNKKELYRHTEKKIFQPWMRVAAALIVMAVGGIIYLDQDRSNTSPDALALGTKPSPAVAAPANTAGPATVQPSGQQAAADRVEQDLAAAPASREHAAVAVKTVRVNAPASQTDAARTDNDPNMIAASELSHERMVTSVSSVTPDNMIQGAIKNLPVTSETVTRYTFSDAIATTTAAKTTTADATHKGSIKGFLRKATKMIEKRTGIDPTNEDGQLLIGAVAIQL